MAMGVWQWGSSDMRGMSVYGIGVATMGWGGGGIHPHPTCGRGSCQLGLHYVRNVYLERFRPGAICTKRISSSAIFVLKEICWGSLGPGGWGDLYLGKFQVVAICT